MRAVPVALSLTLLTALAGGALYVRELHSRIAELEQRLAAPAARVSQGQPLPPRAAASQPARSSRRLSQEQVEAMIRALGGPKSSLANPVWFATIPNDPEAAEFQKQLQAAFEEAGWIVKGNAPVRFRMKPGVYIFAADEDPPSYVGIAQQALEAAGVEITSSGRGYREFYRAKKAENPDWIGFDMAEDQTYVIAIGRKPEPTAENPS